MGHSGHFGSFFLQRISNTAKTSRFEFAPLTWRADADVPMKHNGAESKTIRPSLIGLARRQGETPAESADLTKSGRPQA